MKKWNLVFGLIFFGLSPFFSSQAQQLPVLDFYYSVTCPHCHDEKEWFPQLKKTFPSLKINEYEVSLNKENREKVKSELSRLGQEFQGVPVNIAGNGFVIGFGPEAIIAMLQKEYPELKGDTVQPPKNPVEEAGWKKYLNYSWPLMSFILGILDGFNPCAMWSLLILLGFILTLEDKKKRWLIGGVFLASSGIIYFGALLTYLLGFSTVSELATGGVMIYVFRAVGLLALFTGILSLKKSTKKEVDCDVRDAESKKKFSQKLSDILEKENIYLVLVGIIGLAFSVNSVELICSFAIPTAFTATLVSSGISFWEQLMAITIYDLAYMLDDLIVFLVAMWTLNLKMFSSRAVQISHLIGGILLIAIGAMLLVNPEFLSTVFY